MTSQPFTLPRGKPSPAFANGLSLGLAASQLKASGSRYLTGALDDVALWSTALTQTQITALHVRQSAAYAGTFTSRAMDSLATGQTWSSLAWTPTLPFFKPLPDGGSSESATNYTLQSASLMSGLVGLWHLDEAGGSPIVRDTSGSGKNGTVGSGVTLRVPGRFGAAAYFKGTNRGVITISDAAMASGNAARTIQLWVNACSSLLNNPVVFFMERP